MDGAQGVPSINRREFLQTTAIAGCVLLLSDPLTALAEGETLEIGRMTGGIQSERGKTCRLPLANWNGEGGTAHSAASRTTTFGTSVRWRQSVTSIRFQQRAVKRHRTI